MIARYRQRFPSAMKCMEETLEACLQALRLPPAHHKRLRTANLLERTFGEHKRRTKVIPHLIARMYVHGIDARHRGDVRGRAERNGRVESVVSRVTRCLSEDFEAFRKRSRTRNSCISSSTAYLRYHQGAEKKEPILVATGYRVDGTRVSSSAIENPTRTGKDSCSPGGSVAHRDRRELPSSLEA